METRFQKLMRHFRFLVLDGDAGGPFLLPPAVLNKQRRRDLSIEDHQMALD